MSYMMKNKLQKNASANSVRGVSECARAGSDTEAIPMYIRRTQDALRDILVRQHRRLKEEMKQVVDSKVEELQKQIDDLKTQLASQTTATQPTVDTSGTDESGQPAASTRGVKGFLTRMFTSDMKEKKPEPEKQEPQKEEQKPENKENIKEEKKVEEPFVPIVMKVPSVQVMNMKDLPVPKASEMKSRGDAKSKRKDVFAASSFPVKSPIAMMASASASKPVRKDISMF